MIKRKVLPTIEKVDLLMSEEAEKLPQKLCKHTHWWWLRSPGYFSYHAAFASSGRVYNYGSLVYSSEGTVRPALRITNLNDCKVDSLFKFGGKWFQVINENTAFCLSDIGAHRFDDSTNDYEKSEIKQFLEEWYESVRNSKVSTICR